MFQNLLEIKLNLRNVSLEVNLNSLKYNANAAISDSTIGQYLLDDKIFAEKFDINWFSILTTGKSSFHLATPEATFIKSLQPFLCLLKEFVHGLKLFRLQRK